MLQHGEPCRRISIVGGSQGRRCEKSSQHRCQSLCSDLWRLILINGWKLGRLERKPARSLRSFTKFDSGLTRCTLSVQRIESKFVNTNAAPDLRFFQHRSICPRYHSRL